MQKEVDLDAVEVEFFRNRHSEKDLEWIVIWVIVDLVKYDICKALTDVNLEANHLQRYIRICLPVHKELLVIILWHIFCVRFLIINFLIKPLRFYTCIVQRNPTI